MARAKTASKMIENIDVSCILSITSAARNWNAVFVDDTSEVWFEPIACFVLCERIESKKKISFIGSMISKDVGGLGIAEDCPNFIGIAPPGEKIEDWVEIAHKKNKLNGGTPKIRRRAIEELDDDDELEDIEPEPEVVSKRKNVR